MYKIEDGEPHCLECGSLLPYGRTDRKYCSDYCRNRYHNRENRRLRHRFSTVIGILIRNYGILDRLVKIGVGSVPKTDLAQMGYNFDFVTSCRNVGRRTECRCFDLRYYETDTRITNLSPDRFSWDADGG